MRISDDPTAKKPRRKRALSPAIPGHPAAGLAATAGAATEAPKTHLTHRQDPGERLAGLTLTAAMQSLEADVVMGLGMIAFVEVCAADWVEPVRRAWIEKILGKEAARQGKWLYDDVWRFDDTVVFSAERAPDDELALDLSKAFVGYVAGWLTIVGVSVTPNWLPEDLIPLADHHIVLAVPSPETVSALAHDLTGEEGTIVFSADEAAAVSPKLVRLSTRPQQRADQFLSKLRALIAVERATTDGPPVLGVREAPSLARLHGMEEAVTWGWTLCEDLKAFAIGKMSWADVDRGILLSGGPGLGKTLFARALASTCEVQLIIGSYSTWIGTGTGHQGDLIQAMRATFAEARKVTPCIVFIDEVDAFPSRRRGRSSQQTWDVQVVNALLAEIDGVADRPGVVLVAACNNPDLLDPALVRSGRLDRHIQLVPPDKQALVEILREHLGTALEDDDLNRIAALSLGLTGADVERVVRGARRRARRAERAIEIQDMIEEITRPGDHRSAEMMMTIAVHEAGHAVAAHQLGFVIEGISLWRIGGGAFTQVKAPPALMSLQMVQDNLVLLMAGRAAEEAIFGKVSSGAGGGEGSDLQLATVLAARAAVELGLEAQHGLIWQPLPERLADFARLLTDPNLAALVRQRLDAAYAAGLRLMKQHQCSIRSLAERLLARGAMDGCEIREIFRLVENKPQNASTDG